MNSSLVVKNCDVSVCQDEKLLIQTFLNSLTSPATTIGLSNSKRQKLTWEDLANAFIIQYKFNIEDPPD